MNFQNITKHIIYIFSIIGIMLLMLLSNSVIGDATIYGGPIFYTQLEQILDLTKLALITSTSLIFLVMIFFVVIFLFVLANNKLLVSKTNNLFQNIISFLVVVFCLLLCVRSILKVFS